MKKLFYSLVTLLLLSSCGPHRMGCGARGICLNLPQVETVQPEESSPINAVG
jgi:predicted small lipoprotein YifL